MLGPRITARRPVSPALLLFAFFALSACVQPAPPETGDVATAGMSAQDQVLFASARVALPPAGVEPAALPNPNSPGTAELQRFCTTCHALPTPTMHSASDWPSVLRRMWLRMELIDPAWGVPVPEVGDRLVLLRYMMDNALQVTRAVLPDLPGRTAFEETCAKCHALPDPRQHSPMDWFVVVERMSGHARSLLQLQLTSDQIREIVLYLEQASA